MKSNFSTNTINILFVELSITTLIQFLLARLYVDNAVKVNFIFLDNANFPQLAYKRTLAQVLVGLKLIYSLDTFLYSRRRSKSNKTYKNLDFFSIAGIIDNNLTHSLNGIFSRRPKHLKKTISCLTHHGASDGLRILDISSKSDFYFIYNARYCYSRALIETLRLNNINPYVTERTVTLKGKFQYFCSEADIFDPFPFVMESTKQFARLPPEQHLDLCSFYDHKLDFSNKDSFYCTSLLQKNNPLFSIENKLYDILYLTTSLDETVGLVGTSRNSIVRHELKTLAVLQQLSSHGLRIAVRYHPNLKNKSKEDKSFWAHLSKKYIESLIDVYSYDSPYTSYQLIGKSSLVVTNGSTIGAEASYLGKKSVSFLPNTWPELTGCQIYVSIQNDVIDKIFDILYKQEFHRPTIRQFAAFAYLQIGMGYSVDELILHFIKSLFKPISVNSSS